MSGKRQLQKEATKEKIIRNALRVYAENGFSTSTNVIAQEAGVSHGSIFAHFPTLDDLLLCLLQNFADDIGLKLHSISESCDNIADLLEKHLDVLKEYEAFYTRLISEASSLPSEVYNILIGIQSIVAHHFSVVTAREKGKGKLKNIPMHMMFNTWLGLVHYYLQNCELFAPNSSVLSRYGNELVDSFVALITQ